MQMNCPACRKEIALDPADAKDTPSGVICDHCGGHLTLDHYSGRLAPVGRHSNKGNRREQQAIRSNRSSETFFKPRLSTGRDTVAALFVIICVVAILVGALSLTVSIKSTDIQWPDIRISKILHQIERTAKQFLVGRPSSDGGDASKHLLRGKTLVQREAYAEGLNALDQALAMDPDNYEVHFWRGRALVKTGRDEEAISAFETAIQLNPSYSYAYDNLGWIYLRREDYETSLEYLNQSLAIRPENGWAYYNRGRIFFQMGQEQKAFEDAEAACRLNFKKACQLLKRYSRESPS